MIMRGQTMPERVGRRNVILRWLIRRRIGRHIFFSYAARSLLSRLALAAAIVLFALLARAGGPQYVAGSTFFVSATTGQPITWAQGQVNYYTDQGDLSSILPNAAANALVASAFSQWTSVPAVALTATAAGQLAEDVNGSNIVVAGGIITAPADIAPSATTRPVGIVYDADGTVTDALLGTGAGSSSQCFWNAAYGGVDNFSVNANFLHALVVLNGQCAQQSSQLTDVTYRLVRVLGSVLGLGWSQVNLNVITGNPTPTPADFAGFPVMHFMDPVSCVPITACYANPYQLAPDDVAAISRLYPAAGKATTARIHGSVYFVDDTGNLAQPMQGVNVVARWIDPATGHPSRQYAAASVSGFRFTGNAGNPITGFTDALGVPLSQFGSNDLALEGFFDLGGMVIPNGGSTAQYQLTAEAVDSTWSAGVLPYDPGQVAPSGAAQPVVVTVSAGGDFQQDMVMAGSAQAIPPWAASETWDAPAAVPPAGDWEGSLSGYGDVSYFSISAQAGRTLSVAVTALDETGAATETKAAPLIGMWTLGDPQGTPPPAFTTYPFDSGAAFGMSRLDTQAITSNTFLIGIADLRGDGRPDYHYHAHVLYGDSLNPPRISAQGGAAAIQGTGFAPGLTVNLGSITVPQLAVNAGQMLLALPALADGVQTITINDPASGSFSTMTNALTIGAAATDRLLLVQGSNSRTAIGTQAPLPVIVKVVAADGVTPIDGATIGWSTATGTALSVCREASACTSFADESGVASTLLTPGAAGTITTVATLAPGVYTPAQSVAATLVAFSSSPSLDLGVVPQYLSVAEAATVTVPLTARVLNNGAPQSGVLVNFFIAQGTGTLSAASASTNAGGYAAVSLNLVNLSSGVMLNACLAPGNNPCQTIQIYDVPAAMLKLQEFSGAGQIISGQSFQPVMVRVTDSSAVPVPVMGASVTFLSTLLRPPGDPVVAPGGDPVTTNPAMPVILGVTQTVVSSDLDGLASLGPSTGSFAAPLEVAIVVSAGTSASMMQLEAVAGAGGGMSTPGTGGTSPGRSPILLTEARRRGPANDPAACFVGVSPRRWLTAGLLPLVAKIYNRTGFNHLAGKEVDSPPVYIFRLTGGLRAETARSRRRKAQPPLHLQCHLRGRTRPWERWRDPGMRETLPAGKIVPSWRPAGPSYDFSTTSTNRQ